MRAPQTDVPKSLNTKGVSDTPCEISEDEKNSLWQRLYEVDPESALIIHKNNVRRVRRAIEIFEETGIPKSRLDKLSREKPQDISIEMITLDFKNRDNLYSRIDARVDEMMRCGLLDEVRRLYDGGLLRKDSTAAQAIGYKELTRYLDGEISLDGAVDLIKLSSRRYAKRQLTWFRHNKDAYRLFVDDDDGTLRSFDDVLKEALNVSREMLAKISTKGDSDEIC
jgi:tRNA dimethylallyltransferase